MAEVGIAGGNLLNVTRQQTSVTGRAPRDRREQQVRALQPLSAQARGLALQQQRLDIARKQQEQAQAAQKTANLINIGKTGLQGISLADEAGIIDLEQIGESIFGAGPGAAPGAGGSTVTGAATPVAGTAPAGGALGGSTATGLATPIAGQSAALGGSTATGAALPVAGTAPAGALAGGSTATGAAAPAAGQTVAAGAATTAAPTASSAGGGLGTTGLLGPTSTTGAITGGALGGVAGGQLARNLEGVGPIGSKKADRVEAGVATLGISELVGTNEDVNANIARTGRGIAFGAGIGFATGGPVGAIAGGISGGLSANVNVGGEAGESERGSDLNVCIIVTAATSRDSEEVEVTRVFRDNKMTDAEIRGYYILAEPIAARMGKDEEYRQAIKKSLVDPLVKYGRFVVGMPLNAEAPDHAETRVAQVFLAMCSILGEANPYFKRSNGEEV